MAVELVIEAGIGGPAFVAALEELLGQRLIVLCDGSAGLALESLRTGLRRLVFAGDPAQARRLADIADQLGGEVLTALPGSLHGRSSDGRRFVPLRPSVDLGGDAPLVP